MENGKEVTVSYFRQDEFRCPHCDVVIVSAFLIHKLNKIREAFGKPMIVNSGYRCEYWNEKVGGKPNSAHRKGTAADIQCSSSHDRLLLIRLALEVGFTRIGVGKDFIHLDVDTLLPQEVLWVY